MSRYDENAAECLGFLCEIGDSGIWGQAWRPLPPLVLTLQASHFVAVMSAAWERNRGHPMDIQLVMLAVALLCM
eukprot:COSAG01_NODE_73158_length_251_cov_0.611842_1_plen_73_part_01